MGLTVVAEVTVTVHVPVPVHPPPFQPAKVYPAAAVAVSVTCVPFAKLAPQICGQLIPVGLLLTVPAVPGLPAGEYVTVRRLELVDGVNVGVTVIAEFTVMTQSLVPEQPPPLQPANMLPADALAVSVTRVPLAKLATHWPGLSELLVLPLQLTAAGVLITVPVFAAGGVTVN